MSYPNVPPPVPAILRAAAILVAVGTIAFLFVGGGWRAENAFLVPDLVLAAALAVAAFLPARRAAPALLAAFSLAAGVLGVASMTYVVEGRIGPGATVGWVASTIAAAVLLAFTRRAAPANEPGR